MSTLASSCNLRAFRYQLIHLPKTLPKRKSKYLFFFCICVFICNFYLSVSSEIKLQEKCCVSNMQTWRTCLAAATRSQETEDMILRSCRAGRKWGHIWRFKKMRRALAQMCDQIMSNREFLWLCPGCASTRSWIWSYFEINGHDLIFDKWSLGTNFPSLLNGHREMRYLFFLFKMLNGSFHMGLTVNHDLKIQPSVSILLRNLALSLL